MLNFFYFHLSGVELAMKLTSNKQVKRECAAILEGIRVRNFFEIFIPKIKYFYDLSNSMKQEFYMKKVKVGIKRRKFTLKIKIGIFLLLSK